MDEYKVDIKFPRKTDADPNIVTIVGAEENVADARERLLNLEEEYVSIACSLRESHSLSRNKFVIVNYPQKIFIHDRCKM